MKLAVMAIYNRVTLWILCRLIFMRSKTFYTFYTRDFTISSEVWRLSKLTHSSYISNVLYSRVFHSMVQRPFNQIDAISFLIAIQLAFVTSSIILLFTWTVVKFCFFWYLRAYSCQHSLNGFSGDSLISPNSHLNRIVNQHKIGR